MILSCWYLYFRTFFILRIYLDYFAYDQAYALCVCGIVPLSVCGCVISCILVTHVSEPFILCFLPCLCFDVIHSNIWDTKQPTENCHRPVCVCVFVWGRETSICLLWQTRSVTLVALLTVFSVGWLKLMRQSSVDTSDGACFFFL